MHGKPRIFRVVQYVIAKIGLWLQVYHHFLVFVRFDAFQTWCITHFNGVIGGIEIFFEIHTCANSVLMHVLVVQFGCYQIQCKKYLFITQQQQDFASKTLIFIGVRICNEICMLNRHLTVVIAFGSKFYKNNNQF